MRNGIEYFYFNKHFIPINEVDHILALSSYNKDLTRMNSSESDYDIIRVVRWRDDDVAFVSKIYDFIDKFFNDREFLQISMLFFKDKKLLNLQ